MNYLIAQEAAAKAQTNMADALIYTVVCLLAGFIVWCLFYPHKTT